MFIGNGLYCVYCRDDLIAVLNTAMQVEAFCASLQYSHDMSTIHVKWGTDTYQLKNVFNKLTEKKQ